MIRLGLRLSLSSGREAAARLALIVAGVAAGVAVLLATLSLFNAFQATGGRACWECTNGSAPSGWALDATADGALWNYHEDFYGGRTIKRLDAAALGARAPVVPGLSRMPGPGQYYASPALAALLDSAPPEELAARFPGTRAGLIGDAALSGPDELVVVVGRTPDQVAAMPGARQVDTVSTMPAVDESADVYRFGFGLAAVGLIVPLLVLVGTATRLAAARRETRFAAIRLVGATTRQVNVLAAVDAALGALTGTLAGFAIFQLVRPAVTGVRITGARFFPDLVAPHLWQYAAVLGGVPVVAACAALWSLRRVRISPLGVARKTAASPPRAWRVIPLLAGLGMFLGPVYRNGKPDDLLAFVALALVMAGLMLAGPWLTMVAARLAARLTRGGATLLAARRLAADPKTAFRSVSGLVLAVFIGTTIAALVPTVVAGQQKVAGGTLNDVLGARFSRPGVSGLSPRAGTELLARLRARPGVDVLPIYARADMEVVPPRPDGPPPAPYVVECSDLARFPRARPLPCEHRRQGRPGRGGQLRPHRRRRQPPHRRQTPSAGGPGQPARLRRRARPGGRHDHHTRSRDVGAAAHPAGRLHRRSADDLRRGRPGQGGPVHPGGERRAGHGRAHPDRRRLRPRGGGRRRAGGAQAAVHPAAAGGHAHAYPGRGGAAGVGAAARAGRRARRRRRLRCGRAAHRRPRDEERVVRDAGPVYFASLGGGLAASLLVILTTLPLLRRMTTPDNARFE
nr:FtsX-like permease family protein [Microbispora sp. GKU 823]